MIPVRRTPLIFAVALVGCVASLAALTLAFGRGGSVAFSPDTLQAGWRAEWHVPFTDVAVWRGARAQHRWPLVEHLVSRGYWVPSPDSGRPRWVETSRWRPGVRDGTTRFEYEMIGQGEEWVRWTDANPELARVLWPPLLASLRHARGPGVLDQGAALMVARHARSPEELSRDLDELFSTTPLGGE